MCCIFTCCGWIIDLVQRAWVFAMSCCISSSVCCLMVTGSMSGIALGYNYSLAEYIDLKETNVSVYIKRGVFDDEIADDMEWRRSGRMPVAGHIADDNLRTGAPAEDENTPVQSGRRLEDSVFESDDPNKYEGSLMKLTAQAPYPGITTGSTETPEYLPSDSNVTPGSLDHLKEIQAVVNARKFAMKKAQIPPKTTYPDMNDRYIAHLDAQQGLSGRRIIDRPNMVDRLNPARLDVPPSDINSEEHWMYPKNPGKYVRKFSYSDIDYQNFSPEYPKPIRLSTGPIRPPTPTTSPEMRTYRPDNEEMTEPSLPIISIKPDMESALKRFKEKMMLDKYEAPVHEYAKSPKETSDDYEEDVKGLPVRRRRSIKEIAAHNVTVKDTANNTEKGESVYFYKNPQIILGKDTIEKRNIMTIFDDAIKMPARANLLENKILQRQTSKKSEDSSSQETENIANFREYILNKIWNGVPSKPDNELKFDGDSESEDPTTSAPKTLSTLVISVNDIKPSIMLRILQSIVA